MYGCNEVVSLEVVFLGWDVRMKSIERLTSPSAVDVLGRMVAGDVFREASCAATSLQDLGTSVCAPGSVVDIESSVVREQA